MTLERQLATLRAYPVKPGDYRAARRKREACARLERKLRKKWTPDPNYREPF